MTEPLDLVSLPATAARRARRAVLVLLIACLFWGGSFTWAKAAASAINRAAGLGQGSCLGPTWLLAIRFLVAGLLWMLVFPASRRGWSWASLRRTGTLGFLLWLGMLIQQLGLDRTSEAVNAFLTSLTILFVPLLQTLIMRRRPSWFLLLSILPATIGIWLLTGAAPTGFGVGELLGVLCSVVFSVHIVSLNVLVAHDSAWRLAGGQFLVAGALCLILNLFLPSGSLHGPVAFLLVSLGPDVLYNCVLLTLLATLAAFGAQMLVQPRVDPTRAALVYLMEPVFAAAYAWIAHGHVLAVTGLIGAILILLGNGLGEILGQRSIRYQPGETSSG